MAVIVTNSKLPWPSRLADVSYNCVKWGLLIAAAGVFSAVILSSFKFSHFDKTGGIIGGICFFIGLSSFAFGFVSSSIALVGMVFYRFKIYGAGRALGVLILTYCGFSIGWAVSQPALNKAKSSAHEIQCRSHLVQLSNGFFGNHEKDAVWHDNKRWCDLLKSGLRINDNVCTCPKDKIGPCSYAMNENIPADANELPADLVVLFESAPGWNQVGGPEDVVTDRHGKDTPGANIAFADGRVEFVKAEDILKLRWMLEEQPQDEK